MRRVRVNVPDLSLPDNTVSNTKYTRWNFLPKTLAQQFSKPMNRYFLLIAFLQLDSSLTPVNPASTWGPLIAVTLISMLKEHLDDRKRAESDRLANERMFAVVGASGALGKVRAAKIRVGQLVLVRRDDEVPCDLVVLRTSEEALGAGTCYVQTTNLDGEADLKLRRAPPSTQALARDALPALRAVVECAAPNADIHAFDSTLSIEPDGAAGAEHLGLSADNLLLQATHVRKTAWAIGVAVYVGNQTKLGCNKTVPPFKYPAVEQLVNRFSVAIFCFQLVLTLALGIAGARWRAEVGATLPYLGYDHWSRAHPVVYNLVIPLRFLLLMSLMIPISLAVTLDVLRWTYARWIGDDDEMRDGRTGARAVANSTAVPEDLGQIRYVFADKTGTLTENEMNFRRASIGGEAYGDGDGAPAGIFSDGALIARTQAGHVAILNYWRCIALCNGCAPVRRAQPAADGGLYEYTSPSPDEEALCLAAQRFGVALATRGADGVATLEMRALRVGSTPSKRGSTALRCTPLGGAPSATERWIVQHEIPFSSERKRMSVIARHESSGQLVLFTKGADDAMLPLLALRDDGAHSVGARTVRHIRRFARLGLRTLLIAMRRLDAREYEAWAAQFQAASVATADRSARLAATYAAIEVRLEPLGASAIEDALQPGVPETLRALRDAGVRVWMLTGDKAETALEVARACKLVPHAAFVVDVRPASLVDGASSSSSAFRSGARRPLSPLSPPGVGVAHEQLHFARDARADGEWPEGKRAQVGGRAQAPNGTALADAQPRAHAREMSAGSVESADDDEALPVLNVSGGSVEELLACMRAHRALLRQRAYGGADGASRAADNEYVAVDDDGDDDDDAAADGVDGDGAAGAYALILEGDALARALSEACRAQFYELALGASAVVCARATPSQKAEVVRLVKRATAGAAGAAVRVLAIGDGGNDVAMIQEAHIGVGLVGKEGLQAARAADYTLGRFSFLQRLLLVHGRRAHQRTSAICLYTFYKSIFFASIQVLFNVWTGFSGASFFPSLAVTVWNAPFTMVTGFSLLVDRDVTDGGLLAFPRLYVQTQASLDLNVRAFALWWLRAVLQACFCFWAVIAAFGTVDYVHPRTGAACELEQTGYVGYTVALYVQVLTVYVEHSGLAPANHAALLGCLLAFHLSFWLYSSLPMSADSHGLIAYLYADPSYWLGCGTIAAAAVLPVALLKYAVHHTWPSESAVVQHYERERCARTPASQAAAPRRASGNERNGCSPSGGLDDSMRATLRGEA